MTQENNLTAPQVDYLYREKFNPQNVNGESMLMKLGAGKAAKDYLQVPHRIQWINHDAPIADYVSFELNVDKIEFFSYTNSTTNKEIRGCWVLVTAVIYDQNGKILKKSSDVGSETSNDFADYIEKAVTKAKGRALASIGFGTQFATSDFDAGEKPSPIDGKVGPALADSPLKVAANPAPAASPAKPAAAPKTAPVSAAAQPAPAQQDLPPFEPNNAASPAAPAGFDRNAAMTWLQTHAQVPEVSQLLAAAVQQNLSHLPAEDQRVSKLSDAQLCQVYEASKQHAA